MTPRSPTALRRQLGAELRRLRESRARTLAAAAAAVGWSESKLSRIETGHSAVRDDDLRGLLDAYDVGGSPRRRLMVLAGQARHRAWWEAYGEALSTAYETYIGLEAEAGSLREYAAMVVPGLLQTDEYAHAVIKAGTRNADLVGQKVSVRMARRAALTREPPLELHLVVDEAVFRRQIGGRDLMLRQLRGLLQDVLRPTVTLQALPYTVGAHMGLAGSFTILDFGPSVAAGAPAGSPPPVGGKPANGAVGGANTSGAAGPAPGAPDGPAVYCDGMTGGVFRIRGEELGQYRAAFDALRSMALSPADTEDFIAKIIGEM